MAFKKITVTFPKNEEDQARLRKLDAAGKLASGAYDWMKDVPPEDGYIDDVLAGAEVPGDAVDDYRKELSLSAVVRTVEGNREKLLLLGDRSKYPGGLYPNEQDKKNQAGSGAGAEIAHANEQDGGGGSSAAFAGEVGQLPGRREVERP